MDESGRVTAWISIYVRPEHPVQPLFSLRKKGSEPCDAPVMGKLMLENKLRMAAVASTKTCFGLGARAAAEGAAAPRSVYSTTMLRRQVHQDQAL